MQRQAVLLMCTDTPFEKETHCTYAHTHTPGTITGGASKVYRYTIPFAKPNATIAVCVAAVAPAGTQWMNAYC